MHWGEFRANFHEYPWLIMNGLHPLAPIGAKSGPIGAKSGPIRRGVQQNDWIWANLGQLGQIWANFGPKKGPCGHVEVSRTTFGAKKSPCGHVEVSRMTFREKGIMFVQNVKKQSEWNSLQRKMFPHPMASFLGYGEAPSSILVNKSKICSCFY